MSFFVLFLLPIALISILIFDLYNQRWRRALSILAAPFIAIGLFVVLAYVGVSPSIVRFCLSYPYYRTLVGEGTHASFPWAFRPGFPTDAIYETLIYDKTDDTWVHYQRLELDREKRRKQICGDKTTCSYEKVDSDINPYITRLGGHFYLKSEVQ